MSFPSLSLTQSYWRFRFTKWFLPLELFFSIAQELSTDSFMDDEAELVHLAQQGDSDAFRHLYDHYFPKIYGFVIKRTGHQQTAEDLTSQIFLKSFEKLQSYKAKGHPFGAWLFKIANNTLTDYYRKASTNSEFAREKLPDHPDNSTGAHEMVLSVERKDKILKLMSSLSEKDQHILHLRFFAELSVKEISEVLSISTNSASVRLYRSIRRLKAVLISNGLEALL